MKQALMGLFTLTLFSKSEAQEANPADLRILQELNAKFIHNFVTNDTISHSRIIHKDFIYISSTGRYVNRATYLNDWLHGFDGYVYWDYRDERISVHGSFALVRATNKYIVRRNGKVLTGMCMYTDVYVKEKGVWTCIQAQITPVAAENEPGDDKIVRQYDFRKK